VSSDYQRKHPNDWNANDLVAKAFDERFESFISGPFDNLSIKIKNLEERFSSVDSRITGMDEHMRTMHRVFMSRMDDFSESVSDLSERVREDISKSETTSMHPIKQEAFWKSLRKNPIAASVVVLGASVILIGGIIVVVLTSALVNRPARDLLPTYEVQAK
jgi:t-SNARE complex subunit (syntaxin)